MVRFIRSLLSTRKLPLLVVLLGAVLLFTWNFTNLSRLSLLLSTPASLGPAAETAGSSHVVYNTDASSKRVAIIGAAGYIGSELTTYLQSRHYEVTAIDADSTLAKSLPFSLVTMHSRDISASMLQTFDTIIFLGGCTGRRDCQKLTPTQRYEANIQDVLDLVSNMKPHQHLIAASTSAVTEGLQNAVESSDLLETLLDEYSISMVQREDALRKFSVEKDSKSPKITLLRFGTVVGVSLGQRTDLLVPSLFKSAYMEGVLKVQGPNIMRSFLWLKDLVRLVDTILLKEDHKGGRFHVWHVASFASTILKVATTVASITGARIDGSLDSYMQNATTRFTLRGFSIDSTAFIQAFNFTFLGALQIVLTEFDRKVPDSITAQGVHKKFLASQKPKLESIPCPVCGSTDQQLALDLGDQPFANDFQNNTDQSLQSPKFPLKLVRCRRCNHFHLSHVANREELFNNYLYVSGTSNTLSLYFEWLANKVKQESGNVEHGNVLEIACNDGSQLDQFKKLGWNTFGFDPAANIVPTAQSKGHKVQIGFWGSSTPLDFPELPRGDALTAIVAQNVLAHVPDPISFLKACRDIMGPKTLLYIQTSQCNMHQLGQFDTAYHEHISFFTGHSFLKAAELAGLYITSFETTPIHGTSCLVKMQLPDPTSYDEITNIPSQTLQTRLNEERRDGITGDFFYEKYESRSLAIKSWISGNIQELKKNGFTVGGYGAAAKGMTLLHFLFNLQVQNDTISFILDDSPLKQNRFCPSSTIPVRSTKSLVDIVDEGQPVVLIILAWNFWDEIEKNLRILLKDKVKGIYIILPFPTPKMLVFENNSTTTLKEMVHLATVIPNPIQTPSRHPVLMISHINNEEMLLPFFIIHHAPMFDKVIIIDYESTDQSRWLIEQYAPPSWSIVNSTSGRWFGARETDDQVEHWEREHPDYWAVALTVTEFLLMPQFRQMLHQMHPYNSTEPFIYELKDLSTVGNDSAPLIHFASLPEQRRVYVSQDSDYGYRVLHFGTSLTHGYNTGRHSYVPKNGAPEAKSRDDVGFIFKFTWTPWPESMDRKLSIDGHRPQFDKDYDIGFHHGLYKTREDIERVRSESLKSAITVDLCSYNITQLPFDRDIRFHREFYSAFGSCRYP